MRSEFRKFPEDAMSTISPSLKPFVLDSTDLQFILDQLNFKPLFDAQGNIIVAWNGIGPIFNFYGKQYADQGSAAANIAAWGSSYTNLIDLAGLRDVSGFWNNLTPAQSHYGDTGQIFPRSVMADYLNYLKQDTSGTVTTTVSTTTNSVTTPDVMTESSSNTFGPNTSLVNLNPLTTKTTVETVATGTDVKTTTDKTITTTVADGHHVAVTKTTTVTDGTVTTSSFDYLMDKTTTTLTSPQGTSAPATSELFVPTSAVTTTVAALPTVTETALSGGELDGSYHRFTSTVPASNAAGQTAYALNHQSYAITLDTNAAVAEGDTMATDGTHINIQNVVDYTPRMISLTTTTAGVTYDTWANHAAENALLAPAAQHGSNEIYYNPTTGEAQVLDWGQLETVAKGGLGQVDTQARLAASAGQDDHFIGGLNPGVSPSNGFFVLFGQFFDHGLDFIDKNQLDSNGKNVTIKIALAVDDPLYGMIGNDGQPTTSITINRATVKTVDANGSEYVNNVSPYIDQSQTYGSDAQRTQLLREWVKSPVDSQFHAGMKLFDGTTLSTPWTKADGTVTHETLPTLNELRDYVLATGRDALTWEDVTNLRNRDGAGHVSTGTSGEALLLDMNPRFDAAHLLNGNGESAAETAKVTAAMATIETYIKSQYGNNSTFGIDATTGKLTLHLENLPLGSPPGTPHDLTGANALFPFVNFADFSITLPAGTLHDAVGSILMASVGDHYIAGDGRANENFGLTSIHHVFHEEHNYQVNNLIDALHRYDIVNNDTTHEKLHEFQINTGQMNSVGDYVYTDGTIAWDQDKVFNGAKLIVEMEYQHAAVDQYARNVSPNIQEFGAYATSVNSAVNLEYSQVAFRFGHSTLRETIDTIDPSHGLTGKIMGYALHDAFLNPELYGSTGPAAILLGMSHQQQNEVDEFVTPALNQGLLGQPLDLAAINIARGRDIGIPTLNDFRDALHLARYTSWTDFGQNMQHPSSLVNFIAAYSFDGDMAKAQGIIDAASGADGFTAQQVADANTFLNGGDLGFNHIDTWLGGLAEVHQPGGLLGETFDTVFVAQIENLMDGDRFYYLYRLFGTQFGNEVANGQLKDIIERNTGLTHLNGNIFGYADQYVDLGAHKEVSDGTHEVLTTGNEHKYGDEYYSDYVDSNGVIVAGLKHADGSLSTHPSLGVYTNGGASSANDGNIVHIGNQDYIQDTRLADTDPNSAYAQNGFTNLDGTPNSGAESNEIIVGTDRSDLIYGQGGDDTVYGEKGNDIIFGGFGIDRLYGGSGSDTIRGGDNPDLIDGGSGDDFLYGESSGSDINGQDQVIGGSGNDYISGGIGIDKLLGGTGDDTIYGEQDTDPNTHGDDGNDFIDGGSGTDVLYGDNGDDVILDGTDVDISFGGNGDDIFKVGDIAQALGAGPDEVLGGDGNSDEGNTPGTIGFDIMDFSLQAKRPVGVSYDLDQQTNPLTAINGTQTVPAAFELEGLVGSSSDDTLGGDAGNNWIIGGSGNDMLTGDAGNDLIIGGSIHLNTLIGKYMAVQYDANGNAVLGPDGKPILTGALSSYDHNNNNDGLTTETQLQDARYQGASHRVGYADVLGSGLLGNATLGTQDFDKHYTELLRSDMFKDWQFGDGETDGQKDTFVLTGNKADYTIKAITFNSASDGQLLAYKITDNRTAADLLDGNGNPILDANGNAITLDGTDLLVGVEYVKFRDQTISLINDPPKLDLHAYDTTTTTLADNFDGVGAARSAANNSTGSAAWTSSWVETNDTVPAPGVSNSITTGQIQIDTGTGNGSNQLRLSDNADGASIQRTVDLTGATGATLSFNYQLNSFDAGDKVVASISFDGGTVWHEVSTVAATSVFSNNNSSSGSIQNVDLASLKGPTETLGANAILKFEAITSLSNQTLGGFFDNGSLNNGYVAIDDVTVTVAKPIPDADPFPNYTTTFTENGAAVAIALNPKITDDGAIIHSAQVVLTNAKAGDSFNPHNIAGDNISIATDTSVPGQITLNLTGDDTLAHYQAQIAAITYSNSSNTPDPTDRIIKATVNDGLLDSNVATTTVHVIPVNDVPVTGADRIVTNIGNVTNGIVVPDWALLANDTDTDGPNPLAITAVSNFNSLTATHAAGAVTITDTGTLANQAGGSLSYTVTDGFATGPNSAAGNVTVVRDTTGAIDGGTGNDILIGDAANSTFIGGRGDDIVFAGGGDDTINWNVTNPVRFLGIEITPERPDGHDFVDGGTNGTAGDRFVVTGNNTTETFAIYSNKDDWDGAGPGTGSSAAHAGFTDLNAQTEIVVTRNGVVIAELAHVEEITINTLDTTANNGNNAVQPDGGTSGGDTIQVVGDFRATSLNYSTITVNDGQGGSSVDISALTSDHRIVFNTDMAGHVVGDLRPQDVVNHQITPPTGDQGSNGDGPAGGMNPQPGDQGDGDEHYDGGDCPPADVAGDQSGHTTPSDPVSTDTGVHLGTDGADVLIAASGDSIISGLGGDDIILGGAGGDTIQAGSGDDIVKAGAGNDVVFGGEGSDTLFGGEGQDMIFGDAGDDHIFADAGNDTVEAGIGNDTVYLGAGSDLVIASNGDGDDVYWGEDGSDTLDYAAITADLTVDLGNGLMERGSVSSSQSGHDTVFGFENIIGGSGNDTIVASASVNVMDGGAGNDTFVFQSAGAANGDTIKNFQPGDKIDLSMIDANGGTAGQQSFVLFAGNAFTAAGQVIVSHETIDGAEHTFVSGNTNADLAADFKIDLTGQHNLTTADFNGVH